MADVPLYVLSDYSSSERRITPSWSISQLKSKLESVTGIPPSCQQVILKTPSSGTIPVEAPDEEAVRLSEFPLVPYAELKVSETIGPSCWPPGSELFFCSVLPTCKCSRQGFERELDA